MLQGFLPQLLSGLWVTVQLALAAVCVGLVMGILGAAMKLSPIAPVRWIAEVYTAIFRGLPELLTVLLVYFGGTVLLTAIVGDYVEVSAFGAGVAALGITFGAYATEVFRGAIIAIPKGQIEAAHAYGMSKLLTFRRVVLPQVWRIALPGLGNLFLVLMKDTALVSVVGLEDLMREADIASRYTKEPFTFYMAAAVMYLGLTVVSMAVLHRLEKRANRGQRRAAS
ncbi:Arginine ABC transporter, permease protein ArtQ [Caenispirillum salinarum AK4]|uniref:Arginine ABC transporter, permease protein ArtQ n=1 Tax=Caenispirillum salinarum AK4 TaxID=1238182 RepID=K9HC83_9PROT|nr:ABC transporter permease [Caenispirillum salinarum]EKV28128.1 Arginine ABC transporter, permease protein ArtQ [Caenispirillum salinarum AK4]